MKFLAYIQDVGGPVVIPALAAPKAELRERRGGRRGEPRVGERGHRAHPRPRRPRDRPERPRHPGLPAVVRDRAGGGGRHDERAAAGHPARRRARTCCCSRTTWPGRPPPRPDGRGRAAGTSRRSLAPSARRRLRRAPGEVVDGWFGHPVGLVMHRLFFEQLGPSGVWLEDGDGAPVGFLLGLVSEAEPDLAYVHMHVVDPAWRGQGRRAPGSTASSARGRTRAAAAGAGARGARARGARAASTSGWGSPARMRPGHLGRGRGPDRVRARDCRWLPASLGHSGRIRRHDGRARMAGSTAHDDRRAFRREDVELAGADPRRRRRASRRRASTSARAASCSPAPTSRRRPR